MQNSVSAIRAGRSSARFVLPHMHRHERRLGLHRLFRTPDTRSAQRRHAAARAPLRALRDAARGGTAVAPQLGAMERHTLRRPRHMRWASDEPAPAHSATPWRA